MAGFFRARAPAQPFANMVAIAHEVCVTTPPRVRAASGSSPRHLPRHDTKPWRGFFARPRLRGGRLRTRVRFRGATAASGGDKLTLSPEKCALKQRAYELRRADW